MTQLECIGGPLDGEKRTVSHRKIGLRVFVPLQAAPLVDSFEPRLGYYVVTSRAYANQRAPELVLLWQGEYSVPDRG